MKISFTTLGCKVNQYESEEIRFLLQQHGYVSASVADESDIYIINSCTVTAESSRKTRQTVNKCRREHPDGIIILTGCYPQAFPDEAADCPADIILGNKSNLKIPELLREYLRERKKIVAVEEHRSGEPYCGNHIAQFDGHTRAFIKIQDGCNRFCSYCIIPYARGRSRSRQPSEIANEMKILAENGYQEIVLTGINLSAYGFDIGTDITEAVRIAENTNGIKRIRLGSLEEDHISPAMLKELASCEKFCPQFHLSLQSGSDDVLRRMNRHYTSDEFEAFCTRIREAFDDTTITTDIITGFPGETDADFMQSVLFAEKIGFEKVHIFPYSERSGTRAASFADRVPKKIREERAASLHNVCTGIRNRFLNSQIGKTTEVLFETPKNGVQQGYTRNYTPIQIQNETNLCGQLHRVKITGVGDDCCTGVLL